MRHVILYAHCVLDNYYNSTTLKNIVGYYPIVLDVPEIKLFRENTAVSQGRFETVFTLPS